MRYLKIVAFLAFIIGAFTGAGFLAWMGLDDLRWWQTLCIIVGIIVCGVGCCFTVDDDVNWRNPMPYRWLAITVEVVCIIALVGAGCALVWYGIGGVVQLLGWWNLLAVHLMFDLACLAYLMTFPVARRPQKQSMPV